MSPRVLAAIAVWPPSIDDPELPEENCWENITAAWLVLAALVQEAISQDAADRS